MPRSVWVTDLVHAQPGLCAFLDRTRAVKGLVAGLDDARRKGVERALRISYNGYLEAAVYAAGEERRERATLRAWKWLAVAEDLAGHGK